MATDHTDGAPPNRGSTILVNIGCTANNSAALTKIAAMKAASERLGRTAAGGVVSLLARSVMGLKTILAKLAGVGLVCLTHAPHASITPAHDDDLNSCIVPPPPHHPGTGVRSHVIAPRAAGRGSAALSS